MCRTTDTASNRAKTRSWCSHTRTRSRTPRGGCSSTYWFSVSSTTTTHRFLVSSFWFEQVVSRAAGYCQPGTRDQKLAQRFNGERVEALAHAFHINRPDVGMNAVGQQDEDALRLGVHPDACAGKSIVANSGRR